MTFTSNANNCNGHTFDNTQRRINVHSSFGQKVVDTLVMLVVGGVAVAVAYFIIGLL